MEDTSDLCAALRHVAGEAGTPPPSPSPLVVRANWTADSGEASVDDDDAASRTPTLSDAPTLSGDYCSDDDDDGAEPRVDSCAGCTLEFFRDSAHGVARFYNYTEDGFEYELADVCVCASCRRAYCDACSEPGRPVDERIVVYHECSCVYCVACSPHYEALACSLCGASVCIECRELGTCESDDDFVSLCAACWSGAAEAD